MLTSFKRIIRWGWLNFRRQNGLAYAVIFILVLAIFLINSLFLSQKILQFVITNLQEKVDFSVYFKDSVSEDDISRIKNNIAQIPYVKKIEYTSREDALKNFKERHKDDNVLKESLEILPNNPFEPSLHIKVSEASQYEAISSFLENEVPSDYIDKISFYQNKTIINRIFSFTNNVYKAGAILSLVLVLIAVLVSFNTIRLAIYNFKEEIGVMRLCGASNWLIRGPFVSQGVILGFFSAILALLLFVLTYYFLSPKIETIFYGLNVFEIIKNNLFDVVSISFITGIGVGVFSSLIAIRRYLKV